ncbi:hypothetical protein Y1Q_0019757 [Alligator mississippiensis]|uniref:Uncharacterized protein n=1 Tax=Alligator mississippiensis TaxID=8496 RepID=A0A151PF78_ALLMI|nr:hypothetical protein Y1Q_0019757 [Alligator mississippiensis]
MIWTMGEPLCFLDLSSFPSPGQQLLGSCILRSLPGCSLRCEVLDPESCRLVTSSPCPKSPGLLVGPIPELTAGHHSRGGQKKRFKDTLKTNLKKSVLRRLDH